MITNHEAPQCAIFTILLFPSSENQIFSLVPHSQKPSAYTLLYDTKLHTHLK